MVGAQTCPPLHHTNVCKFPQLCEAISSAILLILRCSFQWCHWIFPNSSMLKVEKTVKGSRSFEWGLRNDNLEVPAPLVPAFEIQGKWVRSIFTSVSLNYIKCSHSYKQPGETLILMKRGISHIQRMATPVY